MIVSDATIWSVTYDRHYDDRNSFIIQATSYPYLKVVCYTYPGFRHQKDSTVGRSVQLQKTLAKNHQPHL